MYIKNIKLSNFRNYDKLNLDLNEKINVFYGDNAQGKTNILEAIFVSAIGRSFRTNKFSNMIKIGENLSTINVNFVDKNRENNIFFEFSDVKKVKYNNIPLKRLSEILGKVYVVLFTPDDMDLFKGSPDNRRKFLNIMISQLRPVYMHVLLEYYKTMKQRNAYLKQIKYEGKSVELLDIWDEKIAEYGMKLYSYRKEFIEKISDKIKEFHFFVTNNYEKIDIKYNFKCESKEKYIENLKKRRNLDIQKCITSYGVHRDDFKVFINDKDISLFGSQGQHRTAILTLKIAELQIIYDEIGEYPILLLDDFISELDSVRRENLLKNILNCQIIITSTDKNFFNNTNAKFFNVVNGIVKEI